MSPSSLATWRLMPEDGKERRLVLLGKKIDRYDLINHRRSRDLLVKVFMEACEDARVELGFGSLSGNEPWPHPPFSLAEAQAWCQESWEDRDAQEIDS